MTATYENDIAVRERIAESMEVEIDEHCEKLFDSDFRTRLGSSKIGSPCSREIWYGFR